jgi:hypothetical protein
MSSLSCVRIISRSRNEERSLNDLLLKSFTFSRLVQVKKEVHICYDLEGHEICVYALHISLDTFQQNHRLQKQKEALRCFEVGIIFPQLQHCPAAQCLICKVR